MGEINDIEREVGVNGDFFGIMFIVVLSNVNIFIVDNNYFDVFIWEVWNVDEVDSFLLILWFI